MFKNALFKIALLTTLAPTICCAEISIPELRKPLSSDDLNPELHKALKSIENENCNQVVKEVSWIKKKRETRRIDDRAFLMEAICMFWRGETSRAEAAIRAAYSNRKSNSDTLLLLALVARHRNQNKIAAMHLREAEHFSRYTFFKKSDVTYARGLLYSSEEKFKLAKGAFERSLLANPRNVLAKSALAELYMREGQRERAIQELRSAKEIEPGNTEVNVRLASYLLRNNNSAIQTKDYGEAKEILSNEIGTTQGKNRYKHPAFSEYVRALLRTSSLEKASNELKMALNHFPSNTVFNSLQEQLELEQSIKTDSSTNRVASEVPIDQPGSNEATP